MKVYVVYADEGYDGNSIPFKAFATPEAASRYCNDEGEKSDEFFYWEELEVEGG